MRATVSIWIPGRLPGENEIIDAAKSGRGKNNAYSRMKHQWTDHIAALVSECNLPAMKLIKVKFVWFESGRQRDPDNIAAGAKFCFDGMVQAGLIPKDTRQHVIAFSHVFARPGVRSGVIMRITRLDGDN